MILKNDNLSKNGQSYKRRVFGVSFTPKIRKILWEVTEAENANPEKEVTAEAPGVEIQNVEQEYALISVEAKDGTHAEAKAAGLNHEKEVTEANAEIHFSGFSKRKAKDAHLKAKDALIKAVEEIQNLPAHSGGLLTLNA